MYITPYLSKDEQDRMRKLRSDLKDRIEEFPDKRWVIRQGVVTSVGNYTARKRMDCDGDDKSLDRSYRF